MGADVTCQTVDHDFGQGGGERGPPVELIVVNGIGNLPLPTEDGAADEEVGAGRLQLFHPRAPHRAACRFAHEGEQIVGVPVVEQAIGQGASEQGDLLDGAGCLEDRPQLLAGGLLGAGGAWLRRW